MEGMDNKVVSLADLKVVNDRINSLLSDNLLFDGTPERYREVMKWWFAGNGVNAQTAAGITELCNRWYTLTRTEWDGYTRFYQPGKSASSYGVKGGSNADMVCVPSTNSAANQDDYAGHPLFAIVDCNWTIDPDTLEPMITAIDGVTDGFERSNPDKYVGVLQQAGWHWMDEDEDYYTHGYSAIYQAGHDYCEPLPEAVCASDSSMRPWVVHGKYMAHVENSKLTCYSGPIPTAFSVSHNTLHTLSSAIGSQYSGGCVIDYAFLQLMAFIKYGMMTLDGVLQGCVNYNYQYYAQYAETDVKRVILKKTEAANLIVGSSVLIGAYDGSSNDRNKSGCYNITGQSGAIITDITDVELDGMVYSAVYVDTAETFSTAALGNGTTGTTFISTFHWKNGSCDNVLGNDGSPDTPGTGRYAAKLQGIEYSVGGYEVMADVILSLYQDTEASEKYWYEPYLVNKRASQSTGLTANYKATGLKSLQPETDSWNYIRKLSFAAGIFFGTDTTNASSSTYTRDGFYKNAKATGTREWLAFGALNLGSGAGGLSFLGGNGGLSTASWYFLGRLSPNGNRGEWAA